LLVQNLVR